MGFHVTGVLTSDWYHDYIICRLIMRLIMEPAFPKPSIRSVRIFIVLFIEQCLISTIMEVSSFQPQVISLDNI